MDLNDKMLEMDRLRRLLLHMSTKLHNARLMTGPPCQGCINIAKQVIDDPVTRACEPYKKWFEEFEENETKTREQATQG